MKLKLSSFLFALLLLKASNQIAFGQGFCNIGGGGFEVQPSAGCAPLTVNIKNTVPGVSLVAYNVAYNGGNNGGNLGPTEISYRYTLPGTATILQLGYNPGGQQFSACKQITVYESRPVVAQYTSCGGGSINLTIENSAISQAYNLLKVEWGDGQVDEISKGGTLTLSHSYADVSKQPILKIIGQYASGTPCSEGQAFVDTVSFQQAQLNSIEIKSLEMRGDGTLRLNYQGVTAIPTEVKYSTNGTNYTTAGSRSSGGLQPYDIKSLSTSQVYSVKLSSQDLCQGQRDSKVISSMTLSGESNEGKNVLKWSQYPNATDFSGYDLLRDGTVIKSFSSISEVTFTDEDVQCGSYSEYQVIAKIGDVTSTSAPVGVRTEISSPKPISQGSVSVLGENVVLIKAGVPGAGPNSTYDLTIEKADAGSTTWRKIITLFNESEYSDISVKTSEMSYCYRMSYQNSCGQKLPPSEPVCTILLKKDFVSLNWTPELPILGGIEGYNVVQTGSSGSQTEIPVQMNTNYTVQLNAQSDLEYNFQIKATSTSGDFESLSNIINYKRSAGVFVPDAFTPNGDGYNDVLEAKSTQLQSFSFSVMNRWGEVVFHSDDIASGWDGTINGANAPAGSYVYKMTFVDDINQTVEKSGTFMLLR